MARNEQRKFLLPTLVVGPADVSRLLMEMEALEEVLRQARLRKQDKIKLPKTSRTMDSLADLNEADLAQETDRQRLRVFLESLQQHAPVVHISFASEPSAAFSVKIVEWLRANVSSYVLVQVGLQPSIAAGCTVRTTSRVFDFSLGHFLRDKSPLLLESIRSGRPDANQAVMP